AETRRAGWWYSGRAVGAALRDPSPAAANRRPGSMENHQPTNGADYVVEECSAHRPALALGRRTACGSHDPRAISPLASAGERPAARTTLEPFHRSPRPAAGLRLALFDPFTPRLGPRPACGSPAPRSLSPPPPARGAPR